MCDENRRNSCEVKVIAENNCNVCFKCLIKSMFLKGIVQRDRMFIFKEQLKEQVKPGSKIKFKTLFDLIFKVYSRSNKRKIWRYNSSCCNETK